MLLKFCVEGYKSFSEKLVFDLSKPRDYQFNTNAIKDGVIKNALVYGRNGVGKTNLGTAILDARSNVVPSAQTPKPDPTFLNADKNRDTASFSYLFRFDGQDVLYEYTKNIRGVVHSERLCVDGEPIYDVDESGTWRINNLSRLSSGSLVVDGKDLYLGLSVLSYVCTNTPQDRLGPILSLYRFLLSMRINKASSLAEDISLILDGDRTKDLEGFLRRHGIEETLVARQNLDGMPVLNVIKGAREIPFSKACSSGTRSLVRLFVIGEGYYDAYSTASFLFLDEFDANYHHDLAESVLHDMLEDPYTQVIATTHNTDLFSNKTLRPDCLFILSKSGIVPAADATTRELREGHNLERLYKAGEFDV